ncbi:hypothetical protein GUJ93_ZPchr0012g21974 [Zizania palustris]|uniref:Uncharacterized protein n=1 Tax=Zizania palustris TaxID=103762 RepID=A0A8J5WRS6_ZIZPA|nr:hypothetical protein GUJ93_ZPchr0012g21974 [Zizania palustris]
MEERLKDFVTTRTPAQICSQAQKHFLRMEREGSGGGSAATTAAAIVVLVVKKQRRLYVCRAAYYDPETGKEDPSNKVILRESDKITDMENLNKFWCEVF